MVVVGTKFGNEAAIQRSGVVAGMGSLLSCTENLAKFHDSRGVRGTKFGLDSVLLCVAQMLLNERASMMSNIDPKLRDRT